MKVSFRRTDDVEDLAEWVVKQAEKGTTALRRKDVPPTGTAPGSVKVDDPPQHGAAAPDIATAVVAIGMIGVGIVMKVRQGTERLKKRGRGED